MKNFSFIVMLCCSFIWTNADACRCDGILSFCEDIAPDSKIVELEVVRQYDGDGRETLMDVFVRDQIQGERTNDTLSILYTNSSCDIRSSHFSIGQRIVTMYTELSPADEYANFPYFSFRYCTEAFLNISGNQINGNIRPDVNAMDLDEFKNSIGSCSLLDDNIRLIVRPNATPDILRVYVKTINDAAVTLELFDRNGQLVESVSAVTNDVISIDLSGYQMGLYFLVARYRNLIVTERIMKI